MRSLSTKLVLAFALTSLAGIALAAIFVRQSVVSEFDAYVLQQRRDEFVTRLGTYYAQQGTWLGVETLLNQARPHDSESESGPRIDFVLADTDGTILLSPNPLWRGRVAPADEIARSTPVIVNGQTVGEVLTIAPPARRNPAELLYLARTDHALAAAGIGAIAVALVLGLLLARVITRPVRELTAAARAIAGGDLRQHVLVRSRDEIGELAVQFNHMSADLDRATELRRRMTADIAHDLRTPLTVLAGYLEALRDETLRPTPARLTAMHDETQVLLHLVEDLHTLSLADAGELPLKRQPVEPRPLLERVAYLYQHAATQAEVTLGVQAPLDLPIISGDVEQLARALGNLVSNALRHTPAGGAVTLTAYAGDEALVLEVTDTGCGISAEHLPNVFERFYRADDARQQTTGGSGLGLAIVRSIVEAHGGQISVSSAPGVGCTFTMRLPVATLLHASAPALAVALA